MERQETEQKIKEIVALQFGFRLDEIESGTNFISDLNADSLDTVEIIMCVEDRFDISVPDEDANNLLTVGAVIDYVGKILEDKGSK